MSALVTFEELQQASGYTEPAQVRAWMEHNGIQVILGKHNRPCTTEKLLNKPFDGDDNEQSLKISA